MGTGQPERERIGAELLDAVDGRYGRIVFFHNDTGAVSQSLRTYGEWAENELSFMRRFVPAGATVLDIGAYVGTHTMAFANAVGATGRVIACEVQPDCIEVLRRNVSHNHLDNAEIRHVAVGGVEGELEVPLIDIGREGSFGSSSIRVELDRAARIGQHVASEPGRYRARLQTIDSFALDTCQLIKIDAEGAEDLILGGATETIRRCSPVLYLECNSVEGGLGTMAKLKQLGYGTLLHVVDAFSPSNFFEVETNIFGSAREAAIVGLPLRMFDDVLAGEPRSCETVVPLSSIDDLVLGLLTKPQYLDELIQQGIGSGVETRLHTPSSQGRQAEGIISDLRSKLDATEAALASAQELAVSRFETLASLQAALEEAQGLALARFEETRTLASRLQTTQSALEVTQALAKERFTKIVELEHALGGR